MKARGVADEGVMVKLLSQYSERLLEMLDEKFAATLAKHNGSGDVTPGGEGGSGVPSPLLTVSPVQPSPIRKNSGGDYLTIKEADE